MKRWWRPTSRANARAEHAADAANQLKALRRQSERMSRTTEHSDYGQPGDDIHYAPGGY